MFIHNESQGFLFFSKKEKCQPRIRYSLKQNSIFGKNTANEEV